jgi:hypothetical protein
MNKFIIFLGLVFINRDVLALDPSGTATIVPGDCSCKEGAHDCVCEEKTLSTYRPKNVNWTGNHKYKWIRDIIGLGNYKQGEDGECSCEYSYELIRTDTVTKTKCLDCDQKTNRCGADSVTEVSEGTKSAWGNPKPVSFIWPMTAAQVCKAKCKLAAGLEEVAESIPGAKTAAKVINVVKDFIFECLGY